MLVAIQESNSTDNELPESEEQKELQAIESKKKKIQNTDQPLDEDKPSTSKQ